MTEARMDKHFTQRRQQIIDNIKKIKDHVRVWLQIMASAAKEVIRPETSITAAAIAYFALFSLFPITLLSISIASFSLGPSMDRQLIIQRLEFIAPAMGQLLGQNIDEIIEARGPVTGIALVGLIWSASTIFYTFTHTLNEIWKIKQRRAVWKRRGLAILFVLIFVGPVLFLGSFAGSLLAHFRVLLPTSIIAMGSGVSLILAVLLDIVLFMALYMILPRGASTWREILPGAIGAGILWEVAKKVFLSLVFSYITVSNLVYGSVAAIIAFLVWAYLSGLIFLFGARISVSYFQFKREQKENARTIQG
jgi:membrane protein